MTTKMNTDKDQELLNDVTNGTVVSSCCHAKVYSPDDEVYICADCKEYCDPVTEE